MHLFTCALIFYTYLISTEGIGSCPPCSEVQCLEVPNFCKYGKKYDSCQCCQICAQGLGQICELDKETCGDGLICSPRSYLKYYKSKIGKEKENNINVIKSLQSQDKHLNIRMKRQSVAQMAGEGMKAIADSDMFQDMVQGTTNIAQAILQSTGKGIQNIAESDAVRQGLQSFSQNADKTVHNIGSGLITMAPIAEGVVGLAGDSMKSGMKYVGKKMKDVVSHPSIDTAIELASNAATGALSQVGEKMKSFSENDAMDESIKKAGEVVTNAFNWAGKTMQDVAGDSEQSATGITKTIMGTVGQGLQQLSENEDIKETLGVFGELLGSGLNIAGKTFSKVAESNIPDAVGKFTNAALSTAGKTIEDLSNSNNINNAVYVAGGLAKDGFKLLGNKIQEVSQDPMTAETIRKFGKMGLRGIEVAGNVLDTVADSELTNKAIDYAGKMAVKGVEKVGKSLVGLAEENLPSNLVFLGSQLGLGAVNMLGEKLQNYNTTNMMKTVGDQARNILYSLGQYFSSPDSDDATDTQYTKAELENFDRQTREDHKEIPESEENENDQYKNSDNSSEISIGSRSFFGDAVGFATSPIGVTMTKAMIEAVPGGSLVSGIVGRGMDKIHKYMTKSDDGEEEEETQSEVKRKREAKESSDEISYYKDAHKVKTKYIQPIKFSDILLNQNSNAGKGTLKNLHLMRDIAYKINNILILRDLIAEFQHKLVPSPNYNMNQTKQNVQKTSVIFNKKYPRKEFKINKKGKERYSIEDFVFPETETTADKNRKMYSHKILGELSSKLALTQVKKNSRSSETQPTVQNQIPINLYNYMHSAKIASLDFNNNIYKNILMLKNKNNLNTGSMQQSDFNYVGNGIKVRKESPSGKSDYYKNMLGTTIKYKIKKSLSKLEKYITRMLKSTKENLTTHTKFLYSIPSIKELKDTLLKKLRHISECLISHAAQHKYLIAIKCLVGDTKEETSNKKYYFVTNGLGYYSYIKTGNHTQGIKFNLQHSINFGVCSPKNLKS